MSKTDSLHYRLCCEGAMLCSIMREGVWQFYDNELFYVSKNIGDAPTVAFPSARLAFWYLIDEVSGKGTWESNPWVIAYNFELVD